MLINVVNLVLIVNDSMYKKINSALEIVFFMPIIRAAVLDIVWFKVGLRKPTLLSIKRPILGT